MSYLTNCSVRKTELTYKSYVSSKWVLISPNKNFDKSQWCTLGFFYFSKKDKSNIIKSFLHAKDRCNKLK